MNLKRYAGDGSFIPWHCDNERLFGPGEPKVIVQFEYEHSTASELSGPRVNLTFRWISQHTKSCPLADAQDLAEPHSCGGGRGTQNVHDLFNGPPGCTRYMLSSKVCI